MPGHFVGGSKPEPGQGSVLFVVGELGLELDSGFVQLPFFIETAAEFPF
jgi:hypothetical protein